MTFSIANGTPNATFLFTVYHHPNLSVPISSSPATTIDGLTAGTYTVNALQTLGPLTNFVQQEVTIEDLITPLTYDVSSAAHNCSVGGEITITTLTGTPAFYEIISGPEHRPLQESNVFEDLPEGTYNIRVFDICGQASVTTYTMEINLSQPVVSQPIFDEIFSGDCDSVTITNTISYAEGTVISYPLDIVYTIHPPNGAPDQIVTQHFESGAPSFLEFSNEFPLFPGEDYTYDIQVTNSCGMQYGNSGMAVNPVPTVSQSLSPLPCSRHYITLNVGNYHPPYTVNFTTAPGDFVPETFNDLHPGPFTENTITYGGEEMPVPDGSYTVEVTDACGRTGSVSFLVIDIPPIPNVSGRNNGCFSLFGRIVASIPDRDIVFAEIIDGPDTYLPALPNDVSAFINDGRLIVTDLPLGTYIIKLIDSCGTEYEVTGIVPPFVEQDFSGSAMADCTIGSGSVRVTSGNGRLVTLSITGAPAGFDAELPLDVSSNIDASGAFYMADLPAGTYTFNGTDFCGIQRQVSVAVTGYQPVQTPVFQFQPNCGSFDINMFDTASSSGAVRYWLQEENPAVPGQWRHPDTGAVYTEGQLPEATNSLELQNNHENVNFLYFGHFRIVKAFETFGTGTASKLCFEVLGDFNYYDGVTIENIYNISCLQNTDDIYIEATGLAPLQYRIERKDGAPFLLNNGQNNIFSGLATGSYEFVVEDACGHIGRRIENIALLPDLAVANDPGGMLICIEPGQSQTAEFDLSLQNAAILDEQNPEVYTLTYHLTQEDADAGTNAMPSLFTNTTNPQTIYARVVHNFITVCHDVVAFEITVSEYPQLTMEQNVVICENVGWTTLSADAGFDLYEWSTGDTTNEIVVTEPGEYTVTVSNVYGEEKCETTVAITVLPSRAPDILGVETSDWTNEHNTITVLVSGSGLYEYSLDNVDYQDSPVFDGLETGVYRIYVRDKNGCGTTVYDAYLLNYPKFFTPNGDGTNDTWRIPYSVMEPNMEINVFDRYGKFIVSFEPGSPGWDGTYNGRPLPSTDYWFVVTRADGKIHRGHFTMKR